MVTKIEEWVVFSKGVVKWATAALITAVNRKDFKILSYSTMWCEWLRSKAWMMIKKQAAQRQHLRVS